MYKSESNFQTSAIWYTQYSLIFNKSKTTYVLINLTESISPALDEDSFGCGIFVDSKKALDNVDHKIPLHSLEYYEIWYICND